MNWRVKVPNKTIFSAYIKYIVPVLGICFLCRRVDNIIFLNNVIINIDKVDKPGGGSGKVDEVFCNAKTLFEAFLAFLDIW